MAGRLVHLLDFLRSDEGRDVALQALGWLLVLALLTGFLGALVGFLPD